MRKASGSDSSAALRMICCAIVVYEHIAGLTGLDLPRIASGKGVEIAVDCFFVLSGFWVTHSFAGSGGTGEFLKKRCRRILPQYIFVIVASALLISFFSHLGLKEYFSDPALYRFLAANLVFLNFLQGSLPGFLNGESVVGALWTMKVEWAFYLLLPLIMFWAGTHSRKETGDAGLTVRRSRIIAVIFCIAAAATVLVHVLVERAGWPAGMEYQIQRGMLFFSCGMLWYENRDMKLKHEGAVLAAAVVFGLFCIWREGLWFRLAFAPAIALQVRWFCRYARPFARFARKLDISYPVYLVHVPVIQIFRSLSDYGRHEAMYAVLMAVVTFVIGAAMHMCFSTVSRD